MTRRKATRAAILGAAILLLLVLAVVYSSESYLGRLIRGIAVVVVENDSNTPLLDVRLSLTASGAEPTTHTFDAILPGENREVRMRTPDLIVDRLEYVIEGEASSFAEGGIACPGERFFLFVKGPDNVTPGYDP